MRKKSEETSFEQHYKTKEITRKINEYSWFGIIFGFLLTAIGIYQSLCSIGLLNKIFMLVSFTGTVLLCLGSFLPLKLEKLVLKVKKVFSLIGEVILKVLVLPIYILITIINLFNFRRYTKKFSFAQWNDKCNIDFKTNYFDYDDEADKNGGSLFNVIYDVFGFFINNKMYVVVPVIIILLILGMIMFFASSSAVFSFVYTLF